MYKKAILIAASMLLTTSIFAGGGGGSSKPLQGMYPIVLSHGLFGWGTDSGTGAIGIIDYWGGMPGYLQDQGAVVYAPTKTATQSNEYRAQELKNDINYFMAANGYSKVHVMGHSQGGLDSRYMVSNLGMSSKVRTLTSISSPHRGSPFADIVGAVIPSWLKPSVNVVLGIVTQIIWGGDQQNALAALASLSTDGMAVFNNNTPNASGVKYYSYSSHVTIPDLIQHPLMGILHPINGAGGLFKGMGFSNDGLVPLSSAKWGTWKGEPSWPWYTTGLDHLQITNTLWSGQAWFDVEGFFLNMAKNAKNNQ